MITTRRCVRPVAVTAVLVMALSLVSAVPAGAAPSIVVRDGRLQPAFTAARIVESVWVEMPMDTDSDGRRDRIAMRIVRPGETRRGLKVATLMEASPYWSGLFDPKDRPWWLDPGVPHPDPVTPRKSGWEDYYVPRGVAVVQVEVAGTGRSEGCTDAGGPAEVNSVKTAIDWLGGRATAYDASGRPLPGPQWSTGNVGMIGTSYNGELQNYVATTGVRGLRTIVPTAALSSKYDYYRSSGAPIWFDFMQAEDADTIALGVLTRRRPWVCKPVIERLRSLRARDTGNYTPFWAERDYTPRAGNVRASVFVVHGLNDDNVKTKQFAQWWEALGKHDVPRKMWLHQGGHTGIPDRDGLRSDVLNRWFAHWLYGVANGVMNEPAVDVERENRTWVRQHAWPSSSARDVSFYLGPNSALTPTPPGGTAWDTYTDDNRRADVVTSNPTVRDGGRLAYLSGPLAATTRISGTPWVDIQATVNLTDTNFTAYLVDYGPHGERRIVTRGWMDARHHRSLTAAEPLEPGRPYRFRWFLQPHDYVFAPGHRIGVVVTGNDGRQYIQPDGPAGQHASVRVELGRSKVTLPIARL